MPRLEPCLWFDSEAEDAAKFYASIFKDGKIGAITRYGKEGFEVHHQPEGQVLTVEFQILGQEFLALNGGPHFTFNEAISLSIDCHSQAAVDDLWEKLSAGGSKSQCGWLKDRYGLSWQVVPAVLSDLLAGPDREKAGRVMEAMMGMTKLDIPALQAAADRK
jgi:predicted 3-demethylubiquinone-9 3-methyltransferase (glyoxalase superfamily)